MEQQRFTLPQAYRSFAERGYLTYPGPSYLWVHDAEWIPPGELLSPANFYGTPKPGLVPFAFTAGHDLWCWQTQRITGAGEPAIADCPRDSFVGDWYAPSFMGWLYRRSLNYVAPMWHEEPVTKQNLRTWARLIREFGDPAWAADVEQLSGRAVILLDFGRWRVPALLTASEVTDRVLRAFGDGYVNAPYVWDIDGDVTAG